MKKMIYLVEDTHDLRMMVEYLLTRQGFEVESFATAQAYSQKLSAALPDLVILDIMLPDGNGLDLCEQLNTNSTTSHIPVLLMSANIYSKEQVRESEKVQFISKPFDIDEFRQRVKSLSGQV